MWEMIERMVADRLWIYTAIIGSLFGPRIFNIFQINKNWSMVIF